MVPLQYKLFKRPFPLSKYTSTPQRVLDVEWVKSSTITLIHGIPPPHCNFADSVADSPPQLLVVDNINELHKQFQHSAESNTGVALSSPPMVLEAIKDTQYGTGGGAITGCVVAKSA